MRGEEKNFNGRALQHKNSFQSNTYAVSGALSLNVIPVHQGLNANTNTSIL